MNRLILLLLIGGLSCRPSSDAPTENTASLYRSWIPTEVRFADGRVVSQSPSDDAITTFVANGTILYGANGRNVACCSPHRFKLRGSVLDFTDVDGIPFPPVDNADYCASINCLATGDSWKVLTLSPDKLVIETVFGVTTYRPYL